MLRKSPLLDVLLGKTQQRILAATLLQPERAWYLLELARHLRMRPSSLQRDLKRLADGGILKRRQNGNRVYFQADTACPLFTELSQILYKTVGVVEVMEQALDPIRDQIDIAFVYGSVAASSERSTSDIDLMVIGAAPLSRIAPVLRALERQMGRPINPTVYGRDEFVKRFHENHFLKTVLREKPLFVIGGPDDLAKLRASATSQAASHQHSRTRRSQSRR